MVTARRPRARTATNCCFTRYTCCERSGNEILANSDTSQLYSFLARRTDSAFNQVVLRRLRMSKMHLKSP